MVKREEVRKEPREVEYKDVEYHTRESGSKLRVVNGESRKVLDQESNNTKPGALERCKAERL